MELLIFFSGYIDFGEDFKILHLISSKNKFSVLI